MSGDGDTPRVQADLLAQQAAFFESYFKKGAEFTRELMQETQRLRARLSELEERLDLERDTELEDRYLQIERENNDLAALYVAQSQLHSSLEVSEVIQVIAEIMLNFVGAEHFAIMLLDRNGKLCPVMSAGIPTADMPVDVGSHESVRRLLEKGGTSSAGFAKRPANQEPAVAIALRDGDGYLGLISVWGFLSQKSEVSELDRQIFGLLASNGGLALEASRLVGEARLRVPSVEGDGPYERITRLIED